MSQNEPLIEAIRTAIGAHGVWKLRLKTAISSGKTQLDANVVGCDDKCDFGKWLYGPTIPEHVRSGPCYDDVRKKHADFHKTIGQIVGAANAGKAQLSTDLLNGEFDEKSQILVHKMQAWMKDLRA